jgi:hypothetical protein
MNETDEPAVAPRQKAPAGVFDRAPEQKQAPQKPAEPKPNFPDPFAVQEEQIRSTPRRPPEPSQEEKDISSINQAATAAAAKEEEDFLRISDADLKLAEQLIFNGYAECNISMDYFPDHRFTICSTNGEELTLIDDMAFDKVKSSKQSADGSFEMSDNSLKAFRNSLLLALSYRGVDGADIAKEPIVQINTLKKAILKMGELYNSGNLKNAEDLKDNIKKALIKRATIMKHLPTPLIDFLSDEKYKFDVKMLTIMNEKKILPKS